MNYKSIKTFLKNKKYTTFLFFFSLSLLTRAQDIVYPSNDAYTEFQNPTSNYGGESELKIKKSSTGNGDRNGYLSFDVEDFTENYPQVLLKLSSTNSSNIAISLKSLNTDIDENTLTWNSQPSNTNSIYHGGLKDGDILYYDVTAYVNEMKNNGDNAVFLLYSDFITSPSQTFASKENTNITLRPQLLGYDHIAIDMAIFNFTETTAVVLEGEEPEDETTWDAQVMNRNNTYEDEVDKYGGLITCNSNYGSTGYFRTQKIDGVWHFVDPDGNLFYSAGINSVREARISQYENVTGYNNLDLPNDLKDLGINTIGSFSDYVYDDIAYTPRLNVLRLYKNGSVTAEEAYDADVLPVWEDDFEERIQDEINGYVTEFLNDPYVIGYFLDNELKFSSTQLDDALDLPSTNPQFQKADQFMVDKYGVGYANSQATEDDNLEYVGLVAEQYFSVISAALKSADPNHLNLGTRINGNVRFREPVIKAAAKYVDVLSINYYRYWEPIEELTELWADLTDIPWMTTEYYTKAEDTGFTNSNGAGWVVETQDDRATFFENWVYNIMKDPNCIGHHWFKFNDGYDTGADGTNVTEQVNYGLLNIDYQWYTELAESFEQLNNRKYAMRERVLYGFQTSINSCNTVITLNDITDDNILNSTEVLNTITLTGTVSGDFTDGDFVYLIINDVSYKVAVAASGLFSIDIVAADLLNDADQTINASINVLTTATKTYLVDITAPVITLTGDNPQTVELGDGYTELGATTDDGSAVVIDATDFTDAVGTYTITYNTTDAAGNKAVEVTRTVNVIETDITAPVITLTGDNPQTVELGDGYTELGATTDDGSAVVIDATDFTDAVGTYTITYNTTDAAGNKAVEVTRTVNVIETDITAPVITLTGDNPQTVELGDGYTELGATTDDGSAVVIDATDFTDAVGTYTITYNTTDAAGNKAVEVTRTVNVIETDITAPVITLTGDNPQTVELGDGYTELGATTDDGSAVVIDATDFTDAVGTYTITYNTTDAAGNKAVEVTRTVNVIETDITAPVITLTGDNPQTVELGDGYTELGATTDDGSAVVIDATDFTDAVGTYTITYNTTDAAGNKAVEVTRTVNVIETDITAPVITLTGDNPQTVELGDGYTELGATTDDGSAVVIDATDFTDAVGTYTITYNTTDATGNRATEVTRTVNVVEKPFEVILELAELNIFEAIKSTQTLSITSNIYWQITTDSEWIFINQERGDNDGEINILVTENTIPEQRLGEIRITGGGITKTISIIQEAAKEKAILLYPNPFIESINILLAEDTDDVFLVKIVDILGKIIVTKNSTVNKSHMNLDLNFLSDGVYYVILLDKNNKVILNKKIIKK
ncbi:immunoglobulin-like domain-containing protein [Maribacter sp. IgM3_T14_3]|uniref:immunoglobulin-like domain-containing protein n=1 Tax=Maribacter sp. IgM3_T14_3 TaxID=3415140 RepID=UPI003C703772